MFSSSYFNDSRLDERGKKKRARKSNRRGGSKRRAKRSGGSCTTKGKHGKVLHGQRCKFAKAAKVCFAQAGGKHNFDFSTMGKCMGSKL